MNLVALDPTKLLVLMAAGAIFALAGLWLMFWPKPEGGAAKLELFGMTFESSSAGLLVFLIGAAFLATPLIVPERMTPNVGDQTPGLENAATDSSAPDSTNKTAYTATKAANSGNRAVILPSGPDAKETEPNNFMTEANQIERGVLYSGVINPERNDPEDWYVLPTAELNNEDVRIQVRSRGATMNQPEACELTILDSKELQLESWRFAPTGSSIQESVFVSNSDFLLLRVDSALSRWCQYEMKVF